MICSAILQIPRGTIRVNNNTEFALRDLRLVDFYGEVLLSQEKLLPNEYIEYKMERECSVEMTFLDHASNEQTFMIAGYAYPQMKGLNLQITFKNGNYSFRNLQ
jgi:hypothetical protein